MSQNYLNLEILGSTEKWTYYCPIERSSIISVGWLSNDDIYFINSDGEYIFDIVNREIIFENFNHQFYIPNENLKTFIKDRNENIDIFGMRGGDGNKTTKDDEWYIEIFNLSWNCKIPILQNRKIQYPLFLELKQNFYEGYKFIGFSKSENYFLIMGDGGIDIYKKNTEL